MADKINITKMPKWMPRPSQLIKLTITILLSVIAWIALGFLLNKLPFVIDHAHEWLQDHVVPGCALRKQPILHYIDNRQIRVFWEGRCSDTESKLHYRIIANPAKDVDFDIPDRDGTSFRRP